MAAPSKSKLFSEKGDPSISFVLQAQLEKCPAIVRDFISQLRSQLSKAHKDLAVISAKNVELHARLELCEEGIIERERVEEKVHNMTEEQLTADLLKRLKFSNKLSEEVGAAKPKRKTKK